MSKFLHRQGATEFMREQGVEAGDTALANLASKGKGPVYSIINGRALYTRENLLKWISEQASASPRTRRTDDSQTASVASPATPGSAAV